MKLKFTATKASRHTGFSLVELSIVLVILGLLVGGVLSGQSLIRAAELRAVSTEYARYTTAAQTFRDKYFAVPGDFRDATRFWSRLNGNADCVTNSSAAVAAPGVCDGDGDGFLEQGAAVSQSGEYFQFWRHLASAGLIEGTYTGLAGPTSSPWDSIIGSNVPRAKLSNAGWTAGNWYGSGLRYAGDGSNFSGDYTNLFAFGATNSGTWTTNSVLKPEEAWNIDTKVDDGLPGVGRVLASTWGLCSTAASNTDYTATYRLNATTISCALYFARAF